MSSSRPKTLRWPSPQPPDRAPSRVPRRHPPFWGPGGITSASCVEELVGIVGNGCTLGPKSYLSSLKPNLRLAGPGIHGQTGLARSDTGSDTCVQYALSDQCPEGAGSWSRMAHHLGRARLRSALPPRGPGKPLGDEALPEGCHTRTIVRTVLRHRLRRLCSAPQEIPYTSLFWASFKREPIYRIFACISKTHITIMRCRHSLMLLISRKPSQTHFQRRFLRHTSFSMHGDRRVYSVPCFRPGTDLFFLIYFFNC